MFSRMHHRLQTTDDTVHKLLATFCRDLRLRSFSSSHELAIQAAKLFRVLPLSIFSEARFRLTEVYPHPLIESLFTRIRHLRETINDFQNLDDAIEELAEDVAHGPENISLLAASLIKPGDTILAFASDQLALDVIRVAAKKLGNKSLHATLMVSHNQSDTERKTTIKMPPNVVIRYTPDSSPVSDLRTATKALVSVEALQYNGTIIARNGTAVIASAARRTAVPLIALAPLYTLAIENSELAQGMKDESENPGKVWEYEQVCHKRSGAGMLRVWNPKWDFVKVDLVVTERGGFCPTYIKNIGKEIFGDEVRMES